MSENLNSDDRLDAAARTLHEEWDSPALWPSIERDMRRSPQRHWRLALAAAACVLLAVSSAWLAWRGIAPRDQQSTVSSDDGRLLSDEAIAEVIRSEAEYARAIDDLSRAAGPVLETVDTPTLAQLRERLTVIDMALAETRSEIDRNPLNAQLRRQLLVIYQEKRDTLTQVAEVGDGL